MGVVGAGIATSLTNMIGYFMIVSYMKQQEEFNEILAISVFDSKVHRNYQTYIQFAVPSLLINITHQGSCLAL